jgi:hypothetical protein
MEQRHLHASSGEMNIHDRHRPERFSNLVSTWYSMSDPILTLNLSLNLNLWSLLRPTTPLNLNLLSPGGGPP